MAERTVVVRLRAEVSDYTAKLEVAGRVTQDLERKVAMATGKTAAGYRQLGLGMVAAGGLIVAGLGGAAKAAADFDAKMALVRTLAKASPADMSRLRAAAETVGQAYGYSAGQVADAEAELVKAGVSVSDIMGGALKGALTLAAAGQTDVATATEVATVAMTQFGLKGKDIPHVADLLAAGADKALGSVTDLSYALDQAGPQASQFGVSLEETVGTLAAFANAGQVGERGGTVFSQMLLQLAAPSKQASDLMRRLGIDAYDAGGQFVGMAGLAGQLQDKMSGLTGQERTHALAVIFGARAIRGANILYQQGAAGIEGWTKNVDDSGFAALQAAGKMDSLRGDVTKLGTALQTAFIGAGEGAQGPLRGLVQDATAVVNKFNELPGPAKTVGTVLVGVAGAITLVGGAAILAVPKIDAFVTAMESLTGTAVSARGALGLVGKAALGLTLIPAIDMGLDKLDSLWIDAPKVDALAASLLTLGESGQTSGAMLDTFGPKLEKIGAMVRAVTRPSLGSQAWSGVSHIPVLNWGEKVEKAFGSNPYANVDEARVKLAALDDALTQLADNNQMSVARDKFATIERAIERSGLSAENAAGVFPHFASAVNMAAVRSGNAAAGAGSLGDQLDALVPPAKQAASATDMAAKSIKRYQDALHALNDPLFAMNQALQDLKAKQDAAAKATQKYGKDSHQAKQANLELAQSAMEVHGSAQALAKSWAASGVTLGKARKELRAWTKDGSLTKHQADQILQSFGQLIGKAKVMSGIDAKMTVGVQDNASSPLDRLNEKVHALTNVPHTVRVTTLITTDKAPGRASGGGLPEGWAAVGEQGPELVHKSGGRVDVFSNTASRGIVAATGMRAPGFAGGTGRADHVVAHLQRILSNPASTGLQIARALEMLDKLSVAWQATVTEINQAAQHRSLLRDVAKAHDALKKANKENGSNAKADVHSATQQLNQARKALEEFRKQAAIDRATRKIDAATARLQAKETLEANREAFEFDRMSSAEQLRYLEHRMAKEKKYSDQWMSDAQQRQQILDQQRQTAESLSEFINPTQQSSVGFAPSIGQLVSNGEGQVDQFTQWLEQLDLARHKGLSKAAVAMLGLDSGPDQLAELLQINKGSAVQIHELNEIARARKHLSRVGAKATLFDSGGVWPSGTLGINLSGHDELVVPHGKWQTSAPSSIDVKVYVGDREITDIVRVELNTRDRDAGYRDRRVTHR
ncbi:MAG: phage tail tape measure protein [Frankiaceae bacterium]|nr:phage tail tape measure protein [Frankiaceae bacterium]